MYWILISSTSTSYSFADAPSSCPIVYATSPTSGASGPPCTIRLRMILRNITASLSFISRLHPRTYPPSHNFFISLTTHTPSSSTLPPLLVFANLSAQWGFPCRRGSTKSVQPMPPFPNHLSGAHQLSLAGAARPICIESVLPPLTVIFLALLAGL